MDRTLNAHDEPPGDEEPVDDAMEKIFQRVDAEREVREMYATRRINVMRYARRYDPKTLWPAPTSEVSTNGPEDVREGEDIPSLEAQYQSVRMMETVDYDHAELLSSRVPADASVPLYKPLHTGSQVRLLEVEAGEFEGPLVVYFHYANLQASHPRYEAISYVWGKQPRYSWEQKPPKSIACGGYLVNISINLEAALRYLRRRNRSRLLWVDALCINQADTVERSHQVTLMSSIYRRATQVIVWLYDEATHDRNEYLGDSRAVDYGHGPLDQMNDRRGSHWFAAVCTIVNSWFTSKNIKCTAEYVVDSKNREDGQVQQLPVTDDHVDEQLATPIRPDWYNHGKELSILWRLVFHLYRCPWFWRMWIVQEVVLASNAVAKMGNVEIDWRWIGLAAAILRTNYHHNVDTMHIGGVYNAYLLFRMSRMSDLKPLEVSFLHLLRLTRQLESSDARDRIYGLLGIKTSDNNPENGKLFVKPDYSIDHTALWQHLACRFIHEAKDLSILSSVQHKNLVGRKRRSGYEGENSVQALLEKGISSWVPQWDHVSRTSLLPWDAEERFSASDGLTLTFGQPPETGSLVVQGIQVGVIGRTFHDCYALIWNTHLRPFFHSTAGTHLLYYTLSAGRNSYGLLASKATTDAIDFLASVFEEVSLDVDLWLQDSCEGARIEERTTAEDDLPWTGWHERPKPTDPTKAAKFLDLYQRSCTNRRLCVTSNGYLVLAPDVVRNGDILYILAGCDLPVLLRPLSIISKQNAKAHFPVNVRQGSGFTRYALVGECYVEGLMRGEAFACLQSKTVSLGPIPCGTVTNAILGMLTDDFNDYDELLKKKYLHVSEREDLIAPGRAAIEQQQQKKLELEWLEIV